MVSMSVSDQVRKLIAESPVSRHRLCKLAQVNAGSMAEFIAGRRGLSMETLDAVGLALGFKVTADKTTARKLAADAPKPGRPPVKRTRKEK